MLNSWLPPLALIALTMAFPRWAFRIAGVGVCGLTIFQIASPVQLTAGLVASLVVGYAADTLTRRHLVNALWLGPVSAQVVAVVVLCVWSGLDRRTALVLVAPLAAAAGWACTVMVLLAHGVRRLRTAS